MQTYKWTDDLSVGVEAIDEQHKMLVELLGELQEKLMLKMEDPEIMDALRRLQKYAEIHFSLEESLMLPIKEQVPNYALHISEHRDFVDTVRGLIIRFVQEGPNVAWELFVFLGDWLVRHIQHTDVVLGKCLKARTHA